MSDLMLVLVLMAAVGAMVWMAFRAVRFPKVTSSERTPYDELPDDDKKYLNWWTKK